jgi:hypothetical protein
MGLANLTEEEIPFSPLGRINNYRPFQLRFGSPVRPAEVIVRG